jgi:hypothetical protein
VVDHLLAGVAAVLWGVATHRLLGLRNRPYPAQTALTVAFLGLAAGATLFHPAVHLAIGRSTGVPNIAEPAARTNVLVAAGAAQCLIVHITRGHLDGRIRGRLTLLVVAVLAMWSLFVAAEPAESTIRFTSRYGGSTSVALYLLAFLLYLAFALVDVARRCQRYAGVATPPLATGLRLIAVGCVFGLAYAVAKAVAVAALALGASVPTELEATVARVAAILAGLLVLVGSMLPAGVRACGSVRRWCDAYVTHRRLFRLWHAMVEVSPEVALLPVRAAAADARRLRNMEMLLYRRVIEIRDGRLALRPHLDARVGAAARHAAQTAGLDWRDSEAAAESAMLRAAVEAARAGRPAQGPGAGPGLASGSLPEELEWLLQVAHHFGQGEVEAVGARALPKVTQCPETL